MKFVTVLTALTVTSGVYAASLNQPPPTAASTRSTESPETLFSKIMAASGMALADKENAGQHPLMKTVTEDFARLFNRRDIDQDKIKEFIAKIPKMADYSRIIADNKFKNIFSDNVVKNILSGNVDSLLEDDAEHDAIDEIVAKMFNIDKEQAAANRKVIYEKVKGVLNDNDGDAFEL